MRMVILLAVDWDENSNIHSRLSCLTVTHTARKTLLFVASIKPTDWNGMATVQLLVCMTVIDMGPETKEMGISSREAYWCNPDASQTSHPSCYRN